MVIGKAPDGSQIYAASNEMTRHASMHFGETYFLPGGFIKSVALEFRY